MKTIQSETERIVAGEMHSLRSKELLQGSALCVPWSSQTIVTNILCSIIIENQEFHGVSAKNVDPRCMDWPRTECLLWVTSDGDCATRWENIPRQPFYGNVDTPLRIESIFMHYELNGELYFGVKWEGYAFPTWEAENDLEDYAHTLTEYCLNQYRVPL